MKSYFPSIWLGDFNSKDEFDKNWQYLEQVSKVFDYIDDRILFSRHPFTIPAFCSACEKITSIKIDWLFGGWSNSTSSIHPAWTETGTCELCGLNSRMRALLDFIKNRIEIRKIKHAYIAEQITPLYKTIKKIIPSIVGSEYLGPHFKAGKKYRRGLNWLRHEDLTHLSFPSNQFDLMITLDVFEHIPNYLQAFSEAYRVLKDEGILIFTIPFFFNQKVNLIRASFDEQGNLIHHLPPEVHGNPLSNEGSLCFQNFGWEILDNLRDVGFKKAQASIYWGPWQGHLGFPFFIFSAKKINL